MYPQLLLARMSDDPVLTKVMSEFEYIPSDGAVLEWDIDAWLGQDLQKYWLKSSGEVSNTDGISVETSILELVYSKAMARNWDYQLGVRTDYSSELNGNDRNWVSFGYIGVAPYFVEVDARFYAGEESSTQLYIELEREMMLTQEWVLTSEVELTFNGRTNEQFFEGSGLSEAELSLRLGYEANGNRKFQPFIGLTVEQTFGKTKSFEKSLGNSGGDRRLMIGLHSWF